jgi:pimeloyl-ACP methyl ester carboxylesterase
MSAITVGGDLVHYEVLGRGRPVILIHGWVGSWRYWIPTMQQLHLKYRVYALDLFGYGDSAKNPERYTIDHQVKMMIEFMDQLGLPKAAMIGHGLGAQVIAEFATLYPDRVARVLMSSAPLFDPGNLDTRVLPGQQVLLTTNSFDVKKAISDAESANKPEAGNKSVASTPTTPAPTTPAPSNVPPAASGTTGGTLDTARRPDIVVSATSDDVTIPSAKMIDRSKLEAAALARAAEEFAARNKPEEPDTSPKPSASSDNGGNPLFRKVGSLTSEALLTRCFKKSEPEYDKLTHDVAKMDDNVLSHSTKNFDAGQMLDKLKLLKMPVVLIHGEADPVIPDPGENVWSYLTQEREDTMLPVPLPGVRHFPMLENDSFLRLVNNFLELPDISKIEVKERWRRRSR